MTVHNRPRLPATNLTFDDLSTSTCDRREWWPGAEWNAGFAGSHCVRLSVLRTSVELPTRGFSVA